MSKQKKQPTRRVRLWPVLAAALFSLGFSTWLFGVVFYPPGSFALFIFCILNLYFGVPIGLFLSLDAGRGYFAVLPLTLMWMWPAFLNFLNETLAEPTPIRWLFIVLFIVLQVTGFLALTSLTMPIWRPLLRWLAQPIEAYRTRRRLAREEAALVSDLRRGALRVSEDGELEPAADVPARDHDPRAVSQGEFHTRA